MPRFDPFDDLFHATVLFRFSDYANGYGAKIQGHCYREHSRVIVNGQLIAR